MKSFLLAFLVTLAWIDSSWAKPLMEPTWIEIRALPDKGGQATCHYLPDGVMKGSHVSPPPHLRVFEEKGQLDAKLSKEVFRNAGEVLNSGLLQ